MRLNFAPYGCSLIDLFQILGHNFKVSLLSNILLSLLSTFKEDDALVLFRTCFFQLFIVIFKNDQSSGLFLLIDLSFPQ
jgi:hypothetical protein